MTMTSVEGRHQRSDGVRTRASILAAAAALATTVGLDRLSIGGLADHIGISKSGLFAHFRSKEALQLATIEAAWQIFDADVVDPALRAPAGRQRALAFVDAYLDHLRRGVFPGGCFFASTSAEFHLRSGPVSARLAEFQWYWLGLIRASLEAAKRAGELDPDEDLDLLGFEIESHSLHAHLLYPIRRDARVLDLAHQAMRDRLRMPRPT
jgi:AcrR family transcriptional regulator